MSILEKYQCSRCGMVTNDTQKFRVHIKNHIASEKETLYDRDSFKLIERICKLRETNPNIKVGKITLDEFGISKVNIENIRIQTK